MTDILLENTKGYYDFEIKNGEFVITLGFETALILSLFSDRRADVSEVSPVDLRRGWWGNLILREILNDPLYELGSKIWLTFQSNSEQTTLNFIKRYIQECLIWLVEKQYATSIFVTVTKETNEKVFAKIDITLSNNLLITSVFEIGEIGKAA